MTTISTNSTLGIVLSSPGYTNPVVVNAGITITSPSNAVDAPSGSWTIQNNGSIGGGSGRSNYGILLSSGGNVTNAIGANISGYRGIGFGSYSSVPLTVVNAGRIAGNLAAYEGGGVVCGELNDPVRSLNNYVYNQQGGTIIGFRGVSLFSNDPTAKATLVNGGLVQGSPATTVAFAYFVGIGVEIEISNAIVSNQSTGTIIGHWGVNSYHPGVNVTNSGTILGETISGDGVFLNGGGTITNQARGLISGFDGILGSNAPLTIVNDGTIAGNLALTHAAGINLQEGGNITNNSTAIISGYRGVANYSGGGPETIVNSGQIHGGTGSSGIGVYLLGVASIYNQIGGTIDGYRGLVGATPGISVENAGLIAGLGSGTLDFGIDLTGGGRVTNTATGTITSPTRAGVYITGATGTVFNSGSVITTGGTKSALVLFSGGYVSNASGAVVSAAAGVGLYTTGAIATVVNAGKVQGGGTHPAVALEAAGVLSNAPTGTISSANGVGVYIRGSTATVVNAGDILGGALTSNPAIVLENGGVVSNQSTGTVSSGGSSGVFVPAGAGTVSNAGQIMGHGTGRSVDFRAGGTVTNQSGGVVTAENANVVFVGGGAGTVVNYGMLASSQNRSVVLNAGGSITNQSGGTISGSGSGAASYIAGGTGTVVNIGRIQTTSGGSAVRLAGGGAVTNQSAGTIVNSIFTAVYISGGAAYVTNAGMITGVANGVLVSGAAGVVINAGTISGSNGVALNNGGTVVNAGYLGGSVNAVSFLSGFANRLVVDPGAVFSGAVTGGNTIGAASVTTLELGSGASAGILTGLGAQFVNFGSVVFDTGATWFLSGNTAGLAGTIAGFAQGDTIEIGGISATGSSYSGGVLTLNEASGAATLNLPGGFTTSQFVVNNVAAGVDVTLACFRAGTHLRTVRGDISVENLQIGDAVEVCLGEALMPIVWIGHRTVDCTRQPDPGQVWPLRIRAEAFGLGLPHRDLFLSPDHAIFINDVLIPIKYLVDGHLIVQEPVNEVTYYHIELSQHNVLLAEGLSTESYLDTGDRSNFSGRGAPVNLHPNFSARMWEAYGCAPLIITGPKLDAVRGLVERAATAATLTSVAVKRVLAA